MSVCAVVKPDTGSRTEADAARFQHAHAEPDEPHDDPDPAPLTHAEQARAREAQGAWKAEHPEYACAECEGSGAYIDAADREFPCAECVRCGRVDPATWAAR